MLGSNRPKNGSSGIAPLRPFCQSDAEAVAKDVASILSSRFTTPDPDRITAIVSNVIKEIGEELSLKDRG